MGAPEAKREIGQLAAGVMDMVEDEDYLSQMVSFRDEASGMLDYLTDRGFSRDESVRMIVGNLLGFFYKS